MKKIILTLACLGFSLNAVAEQNASAGTKNNASATANSAVSKNGNVVVNIPCDASSACAVVSSTTSEVSDALNRDATPDQIQQIVTPKFDFNLMTRFAVGAKWKDPTTTADQKAQLEDNFKKLLIYTYSAALSKFKGAKITITSQQKLSDNRTEVISQVLLPNSGSSTPQTVKVEYDLAKTSASAPWKAYDIKIENASLVTTYRNQFNDIIQSNGIPGLISQLKAKVSSLEKAK